MQCKPEIKIFWGCVVVLCFSAAFGRNVHRTRSARTDEDFLEKDARYRFDQDGDEYLEGEESAAPSYDGGNHGLGYFARLPRKSIILYDDPSLEARFPFPVFTRPEFPFDGAFGGESGTNNHS